MGTLNRRTGAKLGEIILRTGLAAVTGALLCLGLRLDVHAQEPDIKFDRVTIEQGLSNALVLSMCQDDKGFMWFGTEDGLNRYDGYDFTVYKHDLDDPHSLSNSYVNALHQDSLAVLWIGTWGGGLDRFDAEKEQFVHYQHEPDDGSSLSDDKVWALYEDSSGALWVGTEGGLNQFDRETGQFTRYRHDPGDPHSLSHDHIRAVYEDRAGTLWVGTYSGGLNELDRETGRFTRYQYAPDDPHSLSDDYVLAIYEDSLGAFWIGTENGGLNQFDLETKQFTRYQNDPDDPHSLSHDHARAVYEDRSGTLWVGMYGGGLDELDRETGEFIHHRHDSDDPYSLSHDSVWSIYQDQAGILWVGTINGLDKFDRARQKFAHYRHNPNDARSLSNNAVWAIYQDRAGVFWIGTLGGGLNRFDRETGQFTHYVHDPDDPHSLSGNVVRIVYEDRAGMLWVGTENSGLNKFDRETGQFTRYQYDPDNPHSLSHNNVWTIHEDSSGDFWIGTFGGGLNKFDRENERFAHYQHDSSDPDSLVDDYVAVLYQDSLGVFWIGTAGGVDRFDRENERFIHYVHDPNDPHSLSNNAITAIYHDQSGTLWVGSLGGLDRFDRAEGTFTHYGEKEGLPNEVIVGILEDDVPPENGGPNFWIGTLGGLSRFNLQSEDFKNYSVKDGLQSDKFSIWAFCKSSDGEMFFGGINGFNAFYPDQIVDNAYIPPVVLTDFQLFNKPVEIAPDSPLPKSITEIDEIELTYRDSVFSFEFAALHYSDPQANQYAYMLEGFDQDWNYTDARRRFATYTHLDGGEYIFRVRASNSDGVWNEEGVSVKITIVPPVWETWWFRTLAGLLVIGGLLAGFRGRIRTVENQRRQLEIQVAERTRELSIAKEVAEKARRLAQVANQAKSEFLSSMSHELRTPLNGILGYVQILKRDRELSTRQTDSLNVIQQSGEHLLTLINDILDLAKIEAGKMELYPADVHLPSFLEGVAGIIRARAGQKDLLFAYEPQEPLPGGIRADETRLRQVLLNLLGNGLKFTDQGRVTFRVSELVRKQPDRSLLRFEIEDSGVGMTPTQLERIFLPFEQVGDVKRRAEGTGLGLTISRRLVRAMGGELQVKTEPGQGSTFWFEVEFPIPEAADAEPTFRAEAIVGYRFAGERQCRVLVVDDKPYNRSIIVDLLEPLGFSVAEAEDGQQGVAQAQALQPDLIVMDLVMPVMTGFEAAQAIRQIAAIKDVVIIAASASVFEQDRQASGTAGCDGFIPKPVNTEQLFDLMATHLDLEWIYEGPERAVRAEISFEPPPPEELAILLEMSRRGNIRGIRERAIRIGRMDDAYRPFGDRLEQLARDYNEEEIRVLIEQYMGAEQ